MNGKLVLQLDFKSSTGSSNLPYLSESIGNGVEFLNRYLSSKMFQDRESMVPLLEFLQAHHYKEMVITIKLSQLVMHLYLLISE